MSSSSDAVLTLTSSPLDAPAAVEDDCPDRPAEGAPVNVTIDWTLRENVRAYLHSRVRRILRKHGYPPDKQEKATQTVLEQARTPVGGMGAGLKRC